MEMSDEQIQTLTNRKWKDIVKQKVQQAAFQYLISENMIHKMWIKVLFFSEPLP